MNCIQIPRLVACVAAALAAVPATASDVEFHEDGVLLPSALDHGDVAGYALDVSGDTLAVGVHGYGPGAQFKGAVFVFTRAGDSWTEQAMLVGSHVSGSDAFGYDLALDGDRLVIGSGWDESGAQNSGSAYVFERVGGVWTESARLVPPTPEALAWFGEDVALEGDRVAIGAPGADGGTGSVTIFEELGGVWTAVQTLSPTEPGVAQRFGDSVDLDGGRLAVGASMADLANGTTTAQTGAVYVFEHDGASFVPAAALTAEDVNSGPGPVRQLGLAVAIEGDTIVAGAPPVFQLSGRGFVFERVGGTWTQSAVLASAIRGTGFAGTAVAVAGDRIALGCPKFPVPLDGNETGAVTVWERQTGGWVERALLTVEDPAGGGQLGTAVVFDGERLIAGDPYSDLAAYNAGAVYTFTPPAATGESFCFGDGLGVGCPCGWNNYTPDAAGCRNGHGRGGSLMGFGSTSVVADDLRLVSYGLRIAQPALLYHGTDGLGDGVVFGNGLRCVGGTTTRVSVRYPDGDGSTTWDGLVASQGFSAGEVARFQVWYRDPTTGCGAGFNLSNGLRVSFAP